MERIFFFTAFAIIIFNGEGILSRKTIMNFTNCIRITYNQTFILGIHAGAETFNLFQFRTDINFVRLIHYNTQNGLSCARVIYHLIREKQTWVIVL